MNRFVDSLPPKPRAILVHLLERLPVLPAATVVRGGLAGSTVGQLFSGFTELDGDPRISVIFTLTLNHDHVFIAVSDGDPSEIARILSSLDEMASEGESLQTGRVIELADAYLERNGRFAAVLLPVSVIGAFSELHSPAEVRGETLKFSLVVFLSKNELDARKLKGHDGLIDILEGESRDILAIRAN